MNYAYTYINKQITSFSVEYTLVVYVLGGVEYRIPKSFKQDSKLIDDEFLRQEASREITRLVEEEQVQSLEDSNSPSEGGSYIWQP